MKGYTGKLLCVDLSTGQISEDVLDPQVVRDYVGGVGLGVRIAYDEMPPETDPFDPASKLIFMTGPVTGTLLGTAGRYALVFKSPLTGILCDSTSSGYWGAELKYAGYDGLIVEGESAKPVYLFIDDGTVEVRDASHLWGMDTERVQDVLREEVGDPKARVLRIGVAGERGIPYACVFNDDERAAGRGGAGAVMGRKKLKAIVVRGTGQVELADPEGFRETAVRINKLNATSPNLYSLRTFGTPGTMTRWPTSNIPTKNWEIGSDEDLCTNLGGQRMKDTIFVSRHKQTCHRCPIGCAHWVKIETAPYQMEARAPEYETLAALGTLCLVGDLEAVAYAGRLCNLYGMDTISCGVTIAFAMECYEKGVITREDTGGIDLTWGNEEALIEVVKQIALGEGIGALLAQGTRKAAEQLGRGSSEWAVHVKGMELPMHDPRVFYSWASTFTTSQRGACHNHGYAALYDGKDDPLPEWGLTGSYPRTSDEGKGKISRVAQNWAHIMNSMAMCFFATILLKPGDLADLIGRAVGSPLTPEDLFTIADRIDAVYRAYNYRCGVRREDERLPVRVVTPLSGGGAAGQAPDPDYQLDEYYELRRLEPDGKPGYEGLLDLGLADVARDLYGK